MSDKLMYRCAIILVIFLILYAGIIFLYKNKRKSEKNTENIQFYTKNVSKCHKKLSKNAKIMLKIDNNYDLSDWTQIIILKES